MCDVVGWYNITPIGVLLADNMGEGFRGKPELHTLCYAL
jgi:hypothetical protein